MVAALGAISGGHFNPAVTVGFVATGRMRPVLEIQAILRGQVFYLDKWRRVPVLEPPEEVRRPCRTPRTANSGSSDVGSE